MTVLVVIENAGLAPRCISWASRIAAGLEERLTVAVLTGGREDVIKPYRSPTVEGANASGDREGEHPVLSSVLDAIDAHPRLALAIDEPLESPAGSSAEPPPTLAEASSAAASALTSPSDPAEAPSIVPVDVVSVSGNARVQSILKLMAEYATRWLLLTRTSTESERESDYSWRREVYGRASCATLLLRFGEQDGEASPDAEAVAKLERDFSLGPVVAAVDDGVASIDALQFADALRAACGTSLTALYVEPDVGALSRDIGGRILRKVVDRALPAAKGVNRHVAVGQSVRNAIAEYAEQADAALIVLGADRWGIGRRWLSSSISAGLMGRRTQAAVIVVRRPIPIAHRLTRWIKKVSGRIVPQLDREQRVALFERIQSSSRWDFDFIALICLSTIIASLGLLQNSAAVVIGAMLVAPLMTPLVGAGLALVQSNRVFLKNAFATVVRGFLLAFAIAFVIGFATPNLQATREMMARGSPNLLDFAVALISGVAASYAMGRPTLFSALPGVAIAAALVPPVATSGMAFAIGHTPLAWGALLLFATNIVAIILGTSAALYAVGIGGSHEHGVVESWVYRIAAVLLVVASLIAIYEFVPHNQIPDSLRSQLVNTLQAEPQARLVEARQGYPHRVVLTLDSPHPLGAETRRRLAAQVRRELGGEVQVQIETRLVSIE